MRESRTYGSVRGALSNERPYRDRGRDVAIRAVSFIPRDTHHPRGEAVDGYRPSRSRKGEIAHSASQTRVNALMLHPSYRYFAAAARSAS
jgi:hypothetical protein